MQKSFAEAHSNAFVKCFKRIYLSLSFASGIISSIGDIKLSPIHRWQLLYRKAQKDTSRCLEETAREVDFPPFSSHGLARAAHSEPMRRLPNSAAQVAPRRSVLVVVLSAHRVVSSSSRLLSCLYLPQPLPPFPHPLLETKPVSASLARPGGSRQGK